MDLLLATPSPFELPLVVCGHGWYGLLPHHWDPETDRFSTVLDLGSRVVEVSVRETRNGLRASLTGTPRPAKRDADRVRDALRHILRLDEDLSSFWEHCAQVPRLRWVAERGGGRLLRSASLFEDLMKLLFTTNCSWAATRLMTERLVSALGRAAPSGSRAFPSAKACADKGERFYRNVVRTGYRSPHCVELARAFASGRLREEELEDPSLSTDELRNRILSLAGFGPYAAGQALRLMGRYDDLALDSWCRTKLAQLRRRKQAPSEASIKRSFARFGEYRGLALWMELTADWHC